MHSIYEQLAYHLSVLGMGMPDTEDLLTILEENLTQEEAMALLMLPTGVAPLQVTKVDEIAVATGTDRKKLEEMLESLAERGLLFSGKTGAGEKGYALQQVGFGFPQTFFWKGEETPHSRRMAGLVAKYFNRRVTAEAFGSTETKPSRYIPANGAIDSEQQAVFPFHAMESVIEQAGVFAVAHCSCRMGMRLNGRPCEHPLEVCLKLDDMAEYLIDRKLGRQITRKEAIEIIRKSEEAGLVHFVDNAISEIKHNCNCCGCACWNVGSIKRRKIPRDILMAVYFIRETDVDECNGCGDCVDICPVDAAVIEEGRSVIDRDWCIGCGLCISRCATGAATLVLRADKNGQLPFPNFTSLHQEILKQKGFS